MRATRDHARPGSRTFPIPAGLPVGAVLVVLAAAAAVFVFQSWGVITFPFPVDYGEGPLLDQAVRLAAGQSIYDRDLTSGPYVVANYPPLFALAQTPWVRLWGPAYWYGRLLSCVSIVASALFITFILQALTGQWTASIVGGGCLLALPYSTYWAPLFRVDALALALSLGALLVLVRAPLHRRALWMSAALLTAAIFTRQSYGLAAPLAAFAWLATQAATRRRAFELAAIVVAISGGALLLLTLGTDGGFLFHTFTANVNEFRVDRLLRYLRELATLLPILLLLGVAFAVAGRRIEAAAWRLVVPYAAAAALTALLIGKVGSNVNYFLELCAALCLATGAALAGLRHRPALRSAVALLLLLQLSVLLGGTRYQRHLRWKIEQRPTMERLLDLVRRTDGIVLADEALGLLPLDGRPVHFQPFELSQLARRADWDPAPFLDELDRRAFAAVLVDRLPWSPIHRGRWTPEMLERLERGYVATGAIGQTVVYRPREL